MHYLNHTSIVDSSISNQRGVVSTQFIFSVDGRTVDICLFPWSTRNREHVARESAASSFASLLFFFFFVATSLARKRTQKDDESAKYSTVTFNFADSSNFRYCFISFRAIKSKKKEGCQKSTNSVIGTFRIYRQQFVSKWEPLSNVSREIESNRFCRSRRRL